jgi:hypothetical protein
LTHWDRWHVRDQSTWSGETERELFFTIQADRPDSPMPRVAVTAPGVEPIRVVVGKTDVAFERDGETARFEVARDTRNIGRPGRSGDGRSLRQELHYDPFTGLGRTH